MADQVPEATIDPAPLTLDNPPENFIATSEVRQALDILRQLDSAPTTDEEISAVRPVLGSFSPDLLRQPLTARISKLEGCTLPIRAITDPRFTGTAGTTAVIANGSYQITGGSGGEGKITRIEIKNVSDSGPMAPRNFPESVGKVPADQRGAISFRVRITACMPPYVDRLPGKKLFSVGAWLERLAHELTVHAEPAVDAIATYRSGLPWPYQWEATQHWMFRYRGAPRYLLWLNRLITGLHHGLVPEFRASLLGWANEQKQTTETPKVKSARDEDKIPAIVDLRELAALLHLSQPKENENNAGLAATLKDELRGISAKAPLWWLPPEGQ
jgi:hypothetical protein